MVVFSSSEIYGDWPGVMPEDVPDKHPVHQLNDYAVSKWVNELQVRNSAALTGTETVTVRLFNTYGPGEPYSEYRSVICKFIYSALHDLPYTVFLNHHRTSSYIDDTCARWRRSASASGRAPSTTSPATTYHDIKTVSDMILRACGKTDRLVTLPGLRARTTRATSDIDATRARDELGHRETVALEEGIARTIAWQRSYYGVRR